MLTGLFAFAGISLSFLVLTNADGEQFCDNFGWTKIDANCFRPFLYYVDGDQAKQLCAKIGGDMVSFIEEASPEYANLVVDELRVAQELQLGMPGKKNGVLCKKPAGNGQSNELFDKICLELATKWPAPPKSERLNVPAAQLVKKPDGLKEPDFAGQSGQNGGQSASKLGSSSSNAFSSSPSSSSSASISKTLNGNASGGGSTAAGNSASSSSNIMGELVHSARLSSSVGGKAEASHSASYVHKIHHTLDNKAS
uniref:C-type lectin domain-containing protein n=1 Tax=Globodera pallida TaxID=36090 RepID=A0A183C063_GLOPA